jgi:voltage-gated potassium channel
MIIAFILTVIIVIVGTIGYMIIEGWGLLDALYMTIITLTTVGYSEVQPLSRLGRIYTVGLIFLGFGFFVYVAGAVVQFMVEGQIRNILGRQRLNRKIDRLKNHYIVCGYGRIGQVLCKKLRQKPVALVVVESNPDLTSQMEKEGVLYICGDAYNETHLQKARID